MSRWSVNNVQCAHIVYKMKVQVHYEDKHDTKSKQFSDPRQIG